MLELTRLKPMHCCSVDRNSFFRSDIWTILEIIVLSLLLRLQIETCQSAQVLLTHGLINSSSSSDSLSVIVGRVSPPISFRFNVPNNHVLDSYWKARYLPWNICLPASPCFTQVLKDSLRLVSFHSFRHHIVDVHNDGSAEL